LHQYCQLMQFLLHAAWWSLFLFPSSFSWRRFKIIRFCWGWCYATATFGFIVSCRYALPGTLVNSWVSLQCFMECSCTSPIVPQFCSCIALSSKGICISGNRALAELCQAWYGILFDTNYKIFIHLPHHFELTSSNVL
jgi:hypothetical protein